jgi:prepilin signal peptidase PulO-like enzyme (type II secretory pathway)
MTVLNLKDRIYSDKFTFSAIGAGILLNVLIGFNGYRQDGDWILFLKTIGLSIAGVLVGGIYLYLLSLMNKVIYKQQFPGGGDIKLMAAMGAFIGLQVIWVAIYWSLILFVFGYLYKVIGIILKKYASSDIPTGPSHFVALFAYYSYHWDLLNFVAILLGIVVSILACICLLPNTIQGQDFNTGYSYDKRRF